MLSTNESIARPTATPSSEPPKAASSEPAPPQPSSSLRWLDTCATLFALKEKDSKDVRCMIEVLQDRVIRSDMALADLERVLMQSVHEFITKQADYCEQLFREDARIVEGIREADSVNSIVATQLDSSQMMSRQLLQRITGIIEAPLTPRASPTATNATKQ